MSMGMVLEATESYLREVLQFEPNRIGIEFNTEPPPLAGAFFIGIDDAGVESRSTENDYYLREIYVLEIGIWKRPGQFPKDRRAELLKTQNVYTPELETLDSLERKVLAALHKNNDWLRFANERFTLPLGGLGDQFINPLRYLGRSKNERLIAEGEQAEPWIGRRLRFASAERLQKLESLA